MTPRQEAAARKKIAKLYQMKARAEAPTQKRIDANASKLQKKRSALLKQHQRELDAFSKAARRVQNPLVKRLATIDAKFEKRISAIARKL